MLAAIMGSNRDTSHHTCIALIHTLWHEDEFCIARGFLNSTSSWNHCIAAFCFSALTTAIVYTSLIVTCRIQVLQAVWSLSH